MTRSSLRLAPAQLFALMAACIVAVCAVLLRSQPFARSATSPYIARKSSVP